MEPQLYIFLKELNAIAWRKVQVVALGGSVMVSLGLRKSTIDVDLAVKKKYARIVKKVNDKLLDKYEIAVHSLEGGDFVTFDIPDFWERAIPYETEFKKVELRLLNINDLLLCKIDRDFELDRKDIETVVSHFKEKLDMQDISERFKLYLQLYKGPSDRKQQFVQHFDNFLRRYYPADS